MQLVLDGKTEERGREDRVEGMDGTAGMADGKLGPGGRFRDGPVGRTDGRSTSNGPMVNRRGGAGRERPKNLGPGEWVGCEVR